MKQWWTTFLTEHGDRLAFSGLVIAISLFLIYGLALRDAGVTLITTIAGLWLNKARGRVNGNK